MEGNDFAAILSSIFTALNTLGVTYVLLFKGRREGKKVEAEGESEIVDAANVNLEGAKLVSTMLKEQIDELKKDLELEKKSRREDADYFRRRIKDIETELRDYRNYAGRLANQVIRSGLIPEPFISSLNETDPVLSDIRSEEHKLSILKDKREEELKNVSDRT